MNQNPSQPQPAPQSPLPVRPDDIRGSRVPVQPHGPALPQHVSVRQPLIARPPSAVRRPPMLRFSPTAWAKLLYFRDYSENEVGGFAVTTTGDLLYVEQFVTVGQVVSVASVSFDDQAVADFFDQQIDAGRRPERFARVWCHTHPGNSPTPSGTDEETFARVFGRCDWAVMFILAQGGKTYCRLRFNAGPGGQLLIPVRVDYSQPFGPADHAGWEREYQASVQPELWPWGDDLGFGPGGRLAGDALAAAWDAL